MGIKTSHGGGGRHYIKEPDKPFDNLGKRKKERKEVLIEVFRRKNDKMTKIYKLFR